jgi:hypothetical protein
MNDAARILEDGLAGYALDEEKTSGAYESTGAHGRATLKKCVARLYRLYGEREDARSVIRRFRDGFTAETHDAPAAFALIVCSASHPRPSSLLAATLPALLAGAPLFPCLLPDPREAFHAPLAAALELAGADPVRIVPEDVLVGILRQIAEPRAGRIVLLGPPPPAPALAAYAHAEAVPCLSLVPPAPRFPRGRETRPDDGPFPFLELDDAHRDLCVLPDLEPSWFRARGLKLYAS